MTTRPSVEDMLERERVANRRKHWVRAVTACNSRCLFCLDSDTPRNLHLPFEDVCAELRRGRDELGADKVIISGGEASLHPRFHELIAYARGLGYDRVQTVTNGWMYADREFFEAAVAAGLGEITFSLHGHTAALHDHLTQHPGSFGRLVKGLVRAVRRPGLIVNVDVVINAQNVAVIDKIVELAISLGIREFDLLSVIPQAAAFDHRAELFYDPEEHAERLRKVFRLNRHPGFTIWTNRFPLPVLEGLEDLIQDPHKMLDEVNGRRHQVRRYLDTGDVLDCRDPERCAHCFIAPFCDSMDDVVEGTRQGIDVLDVGEAHDRLAELEDGEGWAFGARVAARVRDVAEAEALWERHRRPMLLAIADLAGIHGAGLPADAVGLELEEEAQLEALLANPGQKPSRPVRILLTRRTGPWLRAHLAALQGGFDDIVLHQPSWERMDQALAHDLEDPRAFFAALGGPVRVTGLPACLCPGARVVDEPLRIGIDLFDSTTGHLAIDPLARWHVTSRYRTRSTRCRSCALADRCDGAHVNMVRARGFGILRPLAGDPGEGAKGTPPRSRMADGRSPVGPARGLPGRSAPGAPPEDPLATLARAKQEQQRRRRLAVLD